MPSKANRAKKALRQAYWHRAQTQKAVFHPVTVTMHDATHPTPKTAEDKVSRKPSASQILLHYSYHDPVNREIVHTQQTEKLVYEALHVILGEGYAPISAEYGEVLNNHVTVTV